MKNSFKEALEKHAHTLLRVSLGLLFLYFALDKFRVPSATAFMMQNSMMGAMMPTSNAIVYLIAVAESIVGLCLVLKIQVQKAALLATVLLAGIIVIAQIPQDVVLFFLALYLSTAHASKTR